MERNINFLKKLDTQPDPQSQQNASVNNRPALSSQPQFSQPAVSKRLNQSALARKLNEFKKDVFTGDVLSTYKTGDFSRYAVNKEKQINERQQTIDKIIRQAMLSHLQKVKAYLKMNEQLKKQSKQAENRILKLINKEENIYRIIKDPVGQFTKSFMEVKHEGKTPFQYIDHFVQIIFQIKNLRIVDGKIIDTNKFILASIKESNSNNLLLQSKSDQNVYISLGNDRIGTTLFYYGGSLHTKNQLLSFTEEQQKIIMTMVVSYLKRVGIATSQDEILTSLTSHLQKTKEALL